MARENFEKAMSALREREVPHHRLGQVSGGDQLSIRANNETFSWAVAGLYDGWWNSIQRAIESDSASDRIPIL